MAVIVRLNNRVVTVLVPRRAGVQILMAVIGGRMAVFVGVAVLMGVGVAVLVGMHQIAMAVLVAVCVAVGMGVPMLVGMAVRRRVVVIVRLRCHDLARAMVKSGEARVGPANGQGARRCRSRGGVTGACSEW